MTLDTGGLPILHDRRAGHPEIFGRPAALKDF
jgi:hypothetical protein